MESLPIYTEKPVTGNVKLTLPKRENYFCLLSGRKWSVLEEELKKKADEVCKKEGFKLIYLPDIFQSYNTEVLAYNFPGVQIAYIHHDMFVYKILGILQENIRDNESILIRYKTGGTFYYYKFKAETDYEFILNIRSYTEYVNGIIFNELERLPAYVRKKKKSVIQFCIDKSKSEFGEDVKSPADREFTSEQNKLLDIAIDAVAKLQLQGISLDIIKELLTQKIELSKIVITEKYQILLPDYNNKEVIMGPLPKTVFLFFLKHDKEFMFSDLMDYKKELLSIYEKISNRGDKEKMIRSIEQLTDPTNNSICEKCSAVRKAFLEQITYDVARNYFIEGTQGMPKRISLDRNLVEWKGKI